MAFPCFDEWTYMQMNGPGQFIVPWFNSTEPFFHAVTI